MYLKKAMFFVVFSIILAALLPSKLLSTDHSATQDQVIGEAAAQTSPSDDITTQDSFAPKRTDLIVHDQNLEIQLIYDGLEFATQMDFLGSNDILVLQKNDGKVLRISNCDLLAEPVLDLTVSNLVERGLLGIALYNNINDGKTYAFVYFTHAKEQDGDDAQGEAPDGNRLYRFELLDGKLVNGKALFHVSAQRGASHNGGIVTIGPDKNIYFAVGDIASHKTKAQNYHNGSAAEGTSSIIRINPDGESAGAILGRDKPMNQYYAYGIRNSYGLDFDPITNKLWDTENGPNHSDEINLVEPGFNSGWRAIMGFPNSTGFNKDTELVKCLYCSSITGFFDKWINENILGIREGTYSDPEFVWDLPVGVTAIKFLDSDKLGTVYHNDIFVADYVLGNIYRFELNDNRDSLLLEGELSDKVADNWDELSSVVFAQGFRAITDLEVGPDGYLYVLTHGPDSKIYRIAPASADDRCSS